MNRTMLFARLDYLTIKPYLTIRNMLIFLLVFALIGLGSGEPYAIIGVLLMYSTIYASYPFAIGEKNDIDTLYATLPLNKREIVTGRYIFALAMNISMGIIALITSTILMATIEKELEFKEILITTLITFFIFTIVEFVQLPIYFKLGYTKAKFFVYLPIAAFPAAIIAINAYVGASILLPFINRAFLWMQANTLLSCLLVLAIWLSAFTLSRTLSSRFYAKREL